MPALAPDHTPSDVAYAARQGQPAPVSPALARQLSLAEFTALKTQLAAQAAEIAALKSKLATQATQNAAPKSAIPQSVASSPQSEFSNLKSEIENPQSAIRNPQFPDPSSPAFAPLYAREVKHYLPGGDWIMPPMPAAALTRQAHLQRLNYLSTRCELALIERVDRFAVCGIVGPPEGETFAFIMHHLARLTSIYKSITALENDPTIPVGPVAEDLTEVFTGLHPGSAASTGVPPSGGISSPSANSQPDLAQPAMTSVGSVQSVQSVGSSLPQSEFLNPQSAIDNPQSAVPATPAVPSASPVPVIREVPQCPTFSPERLARTLDQTATALDVSSAGILPAHPSTPANPHTPSPTKSPSPSPSPSPSQSNSSDQSVGSVPSVRSVASDLPQSEIPNPQSAIHNPQSSDPPCPRATDPADPSAPRPQCTECDAELCPSRIAVPIFTGILKRTQRCDGACRFCSPKRQHNCPYTLPKYRDGPKV